ncbi:MAG TPA: ABC transporter permease subunit [Acidimicrobiia bacterium]|nr:ABC transporter permease subunit [Acidimicrobiia bacterium]
MLSLFGTEMSKQWRRPRTYVALGLTVAVPIIVVTALKANPPSTPRGGEGDFFFFLATRTGLFLPVAALRVMSRFLLVIVVALFAGDAIASEASWGNLRAMLVRPLGRGRLLSSKLVSAALLGLIGTALIVVTGLVVGGIAYGWHPISSIHLTTTLGPLGVGPSTLHWIFNLGIAVLYVFWSLSSVVAFAFMVSTMTDSPAGAVFAGFGIYVFSQILDGISSLGSIRYALPTHYFDAWDALFRPKGGFFRLGTGQVEGWTSDMTRGVLLPIAYVLVFLGIAWYHFRRKDVLS